jgi:hypothetical protein
MAAIDNIRATMVLQQMLGNTATAFTGAAAPMCIRLMTANGSMTVNGSALVAGGYASTGLSGNFGAATTGAGGPTCNGMTAAAALSWTASGVNWSVTGFEIWDTAATPLRWWFGTFTGGTVTVNIGQILQIAQNAISVSLS